MRFLDKSELIKETFPYITDEKIEILLKFIKDHATVPMVYYDHYQALEAEIETF